MKSTAKAHPIQGIIKYHGYKGQDRIPYHDSISVCTAPARSVTTVEFGYNEDSCIVDDVELGGKGKKRVVKILDKIRGLSGITDGARVVSENIVQSGVGLGSSSSGFAALALAGCKAAEVSLDLEEISGIARLGASSAARSITGGFSLLDCDTGRSRRLEDGFEDLRFIGCLIDKTTETDKAHKEAPNSPFFDSRVKYIKDIVQKAENSIHKGDFDKSFSLAEKDSLSLLAVTMTGPKGWVYWGPETIKLLNLARELRSEEDIPVYFSADTGASAYLNTTKEYSDVVKNKVEDLGIQTETWGLGGEARLIDNHLF